MTAPILLLTPDGTIAGCSGIAADMVGKPFWTALSMSEEGARAVLDAIGASAVSGEITLPGSVDGRTQRFILKAVKDARARIVFLIAEGQPVEGASSSFREEAEILNILNEVGASVAAEIDLERAVQVVTDAATQLSKAAFGAFFYNVINEDGEAYTLYALSGVPREAFSSFPMPRNTDVFGPTFRGEGIVRSPDITKDPRYGRNAPRHGMPAGHLPVRSYLAVPVRSRSSEVLGGLFFGHHDTGVFDERAERIVAAIAVQAGAAIDNARLFRAAQHEIERRKRVEEQLRINEEMLEAKVAERAAELAARNAELVAEAEARKRAEGRFGFFVERVTDYAIYMISTEGIVSSWNTGANRIKGYRSEEIIGQHFSRFFTDEDREAGMPLGALATAAREGKYEAEGWRVRKDGSRFWASVVLDAIRDSDGSLLGYAKITRDITERREATLALQKAQEQLAQAQKMEGIGHLTGGVAHDFNNLLAIITGNIETLQRALKDSTVNVERIARLAENAMQGTRRATSLTQRLLAFARRQPLDPKIVDVNRLVSGMSDLLRRTLGEQVVIETILAGGLWRSHVDPNNLEIAILNLAVNARDAMPGGGSLIIETANTHLDEGYAATQAEVVPGHYVAVSVSDTGSGMTRDVIARAFEPFYTTKDTGHGTGLGLSQVYGFVKQSGGHVRIYSEPGEGTTVRIYLPRLHMAESDLPHGEIQAAPPPGDASEIILVVEDDPDVRANTREMLQDLGYRTLEAENGNAALQHLRSHPEIRLLFTDVGLPGGMNGRQLAEQARLARKDLKVLFTTGYARNAIVHGGRLDAGVQLLTKPFTYAALGAKIRDVLDKPSGAHRILLVEDEPLIQMVTQEHLQDMGFEAEVAGSATEAMTKLRQLEGDVAAVIVDVGLPDRRGDILVTEIRALYPAMAILMASGYGEEEMRQRFKGDARLGVLSKPYQGEQLEAALSALKVEAPKSTPGA